MSIVNRIKQISKRPFVRNVMWVAGGTAGAQAIAFAFSPLITRIYSPEVFGVLGTFQAILAILLPIGSLALPVAIVLPKSNQTAKQLFKLAVIAAAAVSFLTALVLFCFSERIIELFNIHDIGSFIWLLPIALLCFGIAEASKQWFIRFQQFRGLAKANLCQSLLINSAKVLVGLYYPVSATLVTLTALMHFIQSSFLGLFYKRPKVIAETSKEHSLTLKEALIRYRHVPMFRAPQLFLNAASMSMPLLFLAMFFGPAIAGLFSLCKTVMMIPATLLGKSINDVFIARIAKAKHNNESIIRLLRKAIFTMAAVGIVPYLIVIAFGPFIFNFVFGSQWEQSGEFARWMAIMLFFAFINRPVSATLNVLERHKVFLNYEILSLLSRAVVIYYAYRMTNDPLVTVISLVTVGSMLNLGLLTYTVRIASKASRDRKEYHESL